MNSGRPRGLVVLLSIALGAGTAAGGVMLGSPARADATLAGTYTLDSTSIWTAQQVTLTETTLADGTPDSAVERTVNWGDGNVQILDAGATTATHKYPTNGDYTISVTLQDADTAATPGTISDDTVQVTTAGGTFKFNPTWNWTWPGGGHNAKLELSGVPATATRVWVAWGDGKTSLVNRGNTSVTHYYPFGVFNAKVTLENAQGKTIAKSAGWYTTKADEYSPTVTLKVPSSASKASSWKTVQGTAKDTQIGLDAVGVQLWKWTSSKDYYYNFSTNKWVQYTPGKTKIPSTALKWLGVDSAGVWKVGVSGLEKGYYFEVDYVAVDKAGNDSGLKYRVQNLTS